ncbi:hypothetical protein G7Z17_g163 [Cylindrodendrum hubeiense]|uniref:Uncharacterized protein n=1 Tax=Cylindrodendrum hubeiense TaxID=595255 RepID=A0A9P5HM44_9HYPO|nr:hypothetical protein G7Z17_g163 [Cylindrodendrum hubeiense]
MANIRKPAGNDTMQNGNPEVHNAAAEPTSNPVSVSPRQQLIAIIEAVESQPEWSTTAQGMESSLTSDSSITETGALTVKNVKLKRNSEPIPSGSSKKRTEKDTEASWDNLSGKESGLDEDSGLSSGAHDAG